MSSPPPTTPLDPQLFAHALAVLEREQPTRAGRWLFRLLNALVLGVLALTSMYVVQVQLLETPDEKMRPVAVTAACLALLVLPAFLLNLGFVAKLRRATRLRRRLAPSWQRGIQAEFLARRRRHVFANLLSLVLSVVVGPFVAFFGGFGLLVESARWFGLLPQVSPAGNARELALALVVTLLGASCMFLYFMAKGWERLEVVADLRAAIGQEGLPTLDYDALTALEREQIRADRERSIKAASSQIHIGYTYRESRAVRETKRWLPPDECLSVLAATQQLVDNPPVTAEGDGAEGLLYQSVAGTPLVIGYSVDSAARQVYIASLQSAEHSAPPPPPPGEADYTVHLSREAQESCKGFSPGQHKALDQVVGDIAEDPGRYEHLATPTRGGQRVYRHQSPILEVTYDLDERSRTVAFFHFSAPIPARQTIFVSYSHEDREDFKKVKKFLASLESAGMIRIWSDEVIKAGDKWDEAIKGELDASAAAVLLVSQDFLVSRFVNEIELPYLLDAAEQGRKKLFWIPLSYCTIFDTEHTLHGRIRAFESLHKPPRPTLQELDEARRNRALAEISRRLREALLS